VGLGDGFSASGTSTADKTIVMLAASFELVGLVVSGVLVVSVVSVAMVVSVVLVVLVVLLKLVTFSSNAYISSATAMTLLASSLRIPPSRLPGWTSFRDLRLAPLAEACARSRTQSQH
jgi:hypothetical protein